MAQFKIALSFTLQYEGGYSYNPNDNGGETWRGISRKNWGNWSGWPIVDKEKGLTTAQKNQVLATNMELETLVENFYQDQFWDVIYLDQLQCQQLANQLFDIAVNMGLSAAGLFLQRAINSFNNEQLAVDKVIGAKTIAAANEQDCRLLYEKINSLRLAYYMDIIAKNPNQKIFENAWLSRIKPFNVTTT